MQTMQTLIKYRENGEREGGLDRVREGKSCCCRSSKSDVRDSECSRRKPARTQRCVTLTPNANKKGRNKQTKKHGRHLNLETKGTMLFVE